MLRVYTSNPPAADRSWKAHTKRNWPLMSAEWQDAHFTRARCKGIHGRLGPLSCGNSNFTLHRDHRIMASRTTIASIEKQKHFILVVVRKTLRRVVSSKMHLSTQKISSCTHEHDRTARRLENVACELSEQRRPFIRATHATVVYRYRQSCTATGKSSTLPV